MECCHITLEFSNINYNVNDSKIVQLSYVIELLGMRHPLALRWPVSGQIVGVDKSISVALPSCAGSAVTAVVPSVPGLAAGAAQVHIKRLVGGGCILSGVNSAREITPRHNHIRWPSINFQEWFNICTIYANAKCAMIWFKVITFSLPSSHAG